METWELTAEDLKELPLRAIVAWAVRCARRVQPLIHLPEGQPEAARHRAAVEAALRMAEEFAQGAAPRPGEDAVPAAEAVRGAATAGGDRAVAAVAEVAHATASAREVLDAQGRATTAPAVAAAPEEAFRDRVTGSLAENAALAALAAAEEAVAAVGEHTEDLIQAARRDYATLVRLDLGRFPDAGRPIDPSPHGPLGPL